MVNKRTSQNADPEQFSRFLETARKLECDDDKEAFEAKLRKIAQPRIERHIKEGKSKRTSDKDRSYD